MKVARKHIISAIETEKLMTFPEYMIRADRYTQRDGEFGWTIHVFPIKVPQASKGILR